MKILREEEKVRFISIVLVILVAIVVSLLNYGDSQRVAELDGSKEIKNDSTIPGKLKEFYNYYGMINYDTLIEWKIDKSNTVNNNVYYLEGYYICSDLSPGCVYQESYGSRRSDDSYRFAIYAYVDEDGDIKRISSVPINESEIVNKVYDYFEESNLVNYSDTIRWDIDKQTLITDDTYKVYLFEGKYNCISGKDDCVKLQEHNEKRNDSYEFKVYATFVEKDKKLEIVGVTKEYTSQEE